MATKKILCVCIGNSDRSPVMAAVLNMFLKNAGHDVIVDSAGISENARNGGSAAKFAIAASKRIGLDITRHQRKQTTMLHLEDFDLIITASDEIAGQVIKEGADMFKVYNAQISNPWPCQFQEDYDPTFGAIMVAMYRVMTRYF